MEYSNFDNHKISTTLITNKEFKKFIDSTNYKTTAETIGNSFVFYALIKPPANHVQVQNTPWWHLVEGANWKRPFGPNSNLDGLMDHPVVHVSFEDAKAYCEWVDGRLPNELEWEQAANPKGQSTKFPWGNKLTFKNKYMCNTWTGTFPTDNNATDGYKGTSPVKNYPPNSKGMYDVVGNVWEWCANKADDSIDSIQTTMTMSDEEWVSARGGSFLCHRSYCNKHVIGSRNRFQANTTSSNLGFRVLKEI